MIKKVGVDNLDLGMYVSNINCGWLDHPFSVNAFKITSTSQIEKLTRAGIREVYIDTNKGRDVPGAITAQEEAADTQRRMMALAGARPAEPVPVTAVKPEERPASVSGPADLRPTALGVELVTARKTFAEASRIIGQMMADIRLGRQMEIERVEPVVSDVTHSILRNPNAFLTLCRVKNKDDYTFLHSLSVCSLLVAFCRALGHDAPAMQLAGLGGLLHDIGKMRVPDAILNKAGPLTDPEFAIMRRHPESGLEILSQSAPVPAVVEEVVVQHHERYDGSGYPYRLAGDRISPIGQMVAIIDVYDALTSNRCYRQPMEPPQALRKLLEWSKFHFNETLVHRFIHAVGIYPTGTLVRLTDGMLGVVVEQNPGDLLRPTVRLVHDARRNVPVPPRLVKLTHYPPAAGASPIAAFESLQKWGIDAARYLNLEDGASSD